MNDFKSEQLRHLVGKCKAAELNKCRFELYMNGKTKPLRSNENLNIKKVPVLLEELKRTHHLDCEVKDTKKMSPQETKRVYDSSAHWASNPKRPYGISRRIYEIFVSGEAGDQFGREKPAMIVSDSSGDILFVLPHIVKKERFSLPNYVEKRMASYQEQEIVTIFDFLICLKNELENR